jgi:AraC-like DNA-binding protein
MAYNLAAVYESVRNDLSADPRLALSQLSSRFGVCRQTLEKAARAATGKTLRQLRREVLASKACETLVGSPQSVKEVAYALGFKWPQAFARFAKTQTGCSPTQLRRKRPFGRVTWTHRSRSLPSVRPAHPRDTFPGKQPKRYIL